LDAAVVRFARFPNLVFAGLDPATHDELQHAPADGSGFIARSGLRSIMGHRVEPGDDEFG
jgi:hypothetical protein